MQGRRRRPQRREKEEAYWTVIERILSEGTTGRMPTGIINERGPGEDGGEANPCIRSGRAKVAARRKPRRHR